MDVLPGNKLLPSLQSARKPVPANKPKLSILPTAQGTKSSSKAAKASPTNSRQILNEIHMKNKWSNPVFKLIEDPSPVQRLVSTAFVVSLFFVCKAIQTYASILYHHLTCYQNANYSLTSV